MTKEELKQEAEKKCVCTDESMRIMYRIGFIDGAEPREKRIAELEATCNKWFEHLKNREEELLNELNNQNAKYNKQIEELEAQIEKMKSCVNCRYCIDEKCPWQPKGCRMKHWELRR